MKIISKILLATLVALLVSIGAAKYLLTQPVGNEPTTFVIAKGETVKQVADKLLADGLIKNYTLFRYYLWLTGKENKLIAARHQIPANTNLVGLVNLLTSKSKADEITIRFIEGWTIADMADYLVKEGVIDLPEEFVQRAKVEYFQDQYDFLPKTAEQESLEGYLFPDTYRVFVDATVDDIIVKMLDNFGKKTAKLRGKVNEQGKNFRDVVILASILEKEVKGEEDMKIAADIFWRRLKVGMLLQADSTLNYFTGGDNPSLTAKELEIDSPYNSYKYKGLPPTPISNPGLRALTAAVYPTPNDYWYFLTDRQGKAYFAKTLAEHNANKRKYLQK